MLKQLQDFLSDGEIHINVIDVDQDESLVAKYDELVPVLLGQKAGHEAQQICHYFLDVNLLKAFLNEA